MNNQNYGSKGKMCGTFIGQQQQHDLQAVCRLGQQDLQDQHDHLF